MQLLYSICKKSNSLVWFNWKMSYSTNIKNEINSFYYSLLWQLREHLSICGGAELKITTWQTNYPINKEKSLDTLVTVCGWLKHCHMLTTTFLRRKLYLFNFFLMKRYRFLCKVFSKIYTYSWVVFGIVHFRYIE